MKVILNGILRSWYSFIGFNRATLKFLTSAYPTVKSQFGLIGKESNKVFESKVTEHYPNLPFKLGYFFHSLTMAWHMSNLHFGGEDPLYQMIKATCARGVTLRTAKYCLDNELFVNMDKSTKEFISLENSLTAGNFSTTGKIFDWFDQTCASIDLRHSHESVWIMFLIGGYISTRTFDKYLATMKNIDTVLQAHGVLGVSRNLMMVHRDNLDDVILPYCPSEEEKVSYAKWFASAAKENGIFKLRNNY